MKRPAHVQTQHKSPIVDTLDIPLATRMHTERSLLESRPDSSAALRRSTDSAIYSLPRTIGVLRSGV